MTQTVKEEPDNSAVIHLDLHRTAWECAIGLIRKDLAGADDGPTTAELDSAFATLAAVTNNPMAGMKAFLACQSLTGSPVPAHTIADLENLMWHFFLQLVFALQRNDTWQVMCFAKLLAATSDGFMHTADWWQERAAVYITLELPLGTRV